MNNPALRNRITKTPIVSYVVKSDLTSVNILKMKVLKGLLLLAIGTLALTSCVSKKKFTREITAASEREKALQEELLLTKGRVLSMETVNSNLTQSVTMLQEDKLRLENEKMRLEGQIRQLSSDQVDQKQQFESALQEQVKALEEKQKMLDALQQIAQKRNEKLATLKDDLAFVLKLYSTEEASTEVKEGKLILTAADALVFDAGTALVTRKGREAMGLVAAVFAKYPDIDIAIVCHTDNTSPTKKSNVRDNWELSSVRAAVLSRVLTNEFFLNANQVSAVGRGEFQPRGSNETKEGRTLNRRIEIVVTVKMPDWAAAL